MNCPIIAITDRARPGRCEPLATFATNLRKVVEEVSSICRALRWPVRQLQLLTTFVPSTTSDFARN